MFEGNDRFVGKSNRLLILIYESDKPSPLSLCVWAAFPFQHATSRLFLISSPPCASGHFLRLPAAIENVSSHLDETTNIWEEKQPLREEKRLDGRTIIVRLDSFVFTRLLSFLPLCVINMPASMADRRRDEGRMEGRREGCSCCLASFCFLTDTTKSFRRGKTVVFVCRHRAMLRLPTERGWMKELLRQQTHHPSVCQRERERSERRWEEEEEGGKKTKRQWKRGDRVRRRLKDRNKRGRKVLKEPERNSFLKVHFFLSAADFWFEHLFQRKMYSKTLCFNC